MGQNMPTPAFHIPVARPKLPPADAVLPYLREIDERRWYSNFGPLSRALEGRLETRFGLGEGGALLVANATLGITLALMAQDARRGACCLMPAWTFAATGHAARLAGLEPHLLDVDDESWALVPAAAEAAIGRLASAAGAVVAVSPFGAPIAPQFWDDLSVDSGLPVVIDAAAAFDAQQVGRAPVVISLHATKTLGAGEGAVILSRDRDLISAMRSRANFGFDGDRQAQTTALNAKFSEYQAAVGLASLDCWPQTRAEFASVASRYRAAMSAQPGVSFQGGWGQAWISSTCVVRGKQPLEAGLARSLAAAGIESRAWWGAGLQAQPAFATCTADDLPVTDHLARHTLGLPLSADMTTDQIEAVAHALHGAIAA